MKRMAQVDANGIVVNIIVASDDWNVEGFVEYTDDNPAHIGWMYSNGKFFIPNINLDENLIIKTILSADSIGGDSLGA